MVYLTISLIVYRKSRMTFQIAKFDHITPTLIDLHWLSATFRVQFTLLLFVYYTTKVHPTWKIFYPWNQLLLSLKPAANYALHSSAQSLLLVPKVNCSTLGDRAFAHAAPVLWNSLPLTIRTSGSLPIFKKQLKTSHFFWRKPLICWNSSHV